MKHEAVSINWFFQTLSQKVLFSFPVRDVPHFLTLALLTQSLLDFVHSTDFVIIIGVLYVGV